jgi:hypothetical protein
VAETPWQSSAAGGNSILLELETALSSVTGPASGFRAQNEFAYSSQLAHSGRKSKPIKMIQTDPPPKG